MKLKNTLKDRGHGVYQKITSTGRPTLDFYAVQTYGGLMLWHKVKDVRGYLKPRGMSFEAVTIYRINPLDESPSSKVNSKTRWVSFRDIKQLRTEAVKRVGKVVG